jgi:hypothetical protein
MLGFSLCLAQLADGTFGVSIIATTVDDEGTAAP